MLRKFDGVILTLLLVIIIFIITIFYLNDKSSKSNNFIVNQKKIERLILLDNNFHNFLMQSLNFQNYDKITSHIEEFDYLLEFLLPINIIKKKFNKEREILEDHKSLNAIATNSINYLFDLRTNIFQNKKLKNEYKKITDELLFSLMQLFIGTQTTQSTLDALTNKIFLYAKQTKNQNLQHFYAQALLLQKNIKTLKISIQEHREINLLADLTEMEHLLQINYDKEMNLYQLLTYILIFMSIGLFFTLIILHIRALKVANELISFRLAVENSDNSIIMTDTNRLITYVNDSFEKNTGYTKSEVLGKNPNLLRSSLTKEKTFTELSSAMHAQKSWKGEFINRKKDGSVYYVSASIIPIIMNHQLQSYLSINLDITKYMEQKEQLLSIQKGLQKSIKERTTALQDKADSLEEALENLELYQEKLVQTEKMSALGSLVAGVSHEINTPIGISLTGVTYIQKESKEIFNSLQSESLSKSSLMEYLESMQKMSASMHASLQNAASLIRSFKQVAIDQHTEDKRLFNLKNYCDEVILSLHSKLQTEHVSVTNEIEQSIEIYSYAGIYSQIWTNFIMNSILHAFSNKSKDSKVKIKSFIEAGSLYLTYEDNGKGIAEGHMKKIFDPFFTTKLGQGGSGLGLNIIYNLVKHKLNGDIYCENKKVGMQMIITIPMIELEFTSNHKNKE